MPKSFWQYTLVSLCSFVLLWTNAQSPDVHILTSECRRIIGSEIVIRGTFDTLPRDPVEWRGPDGLRAASCEPGRACDIPKAGYSISQQNSGLNYTIVIQSAKNEDSGNWTFKEFANVTRFEVALLPVNLTTVDVFCDWPENETIVINSGSTQNVNCSTECIPGNSILTFSLQRDVENDVSFQTSDRVISCGSGSSNRTSTISLNNSRGQEPGNYTLCYVLTDGECVERPKCKSVVFESHTESTSTTELTTLSTLITDVTFTDSVTSTASRTSDAPVSDNVVTGPTTPCPPKKDCRLIAVLVLACIFLLGSISFLVIVIKQGHIGSCGKRVLAVFVISALFFVAAIILVAIDLKEIYFEVNWDICHEEPEPEPESSRMSEKGISGTVLFALAGAAFIVAVAIYFKKVRPVERTENNIDMKPTNGGPR